MKDNRKTIQILMILTIIFEDTIRPISTNGWFYIESYSQYTIDVRKLDTSLVTDMSGMFYFYGVSELNLIGLGNWDVSKITYLANRQNFDYGVENKIIDPAWGGIN